MRSKVLSDSDERTIALVFEAGDEVMVTLRQFAEEHGIGDARAVARPSRAYRRRGLGARADRHRQVNRRRRMKSGCGKDPAAADTAASAGRSPG
jgi:hypothetical protein